MDTLGLSTFLFPRIENTILQKDYIKSIRLTFNYDESFGNEYVKISYYVNLNERFDTLPSEQQETLSNTFTGNPNYVFSLLTHSKRWNPNQEHEILTRIVDFKNIYISLTSYITIQLEKHLCPGTSIYIQNPDNWSELNYAEKYMSKLLYSYKIRRSFYQDYKIQAAQHVGLAKLSHNSIKLFRKEKALFKSTDKELTDLGGMDLITLRHILLTWNVPIKVDNVKVINTILIHIPLLIEALKKEIVRLKEDDFLSNYNKEKSHRISTFIQYIYDTCIPDEKIKILKQQREIYTQCLPIQKGDLLQLKDNRLVILNNISFDQKNNLTFTYRILKINLEESIRTRKIGIWNISFYIKSSDFKIYQDYTPKKHLSLLKKWMEKRKSALVTPEFNPNVIQ